MFGFFYRYFCKVSLFIKMKKIFVVVLLLSWFFSFSQKTMKGQITDFDTAIPIAFAQINYNNKIVTTDWEGKFELAVFPDNKPLLVSYKGYFDKTFYLTKGAKYLNIKMVTNNSRKNEEIYSENLVNKIVKNVIENRDKNNPEKAIAEFEYKNYEKLILTAKPDSISTKIDTVYKKRFIGKPKMLLDSSNYKFKKLVENQHIYQTEKVNVIQHKNNTTKETILASRMAGFKKPLYEFLGLNLVSYSLYENKLEILEIPVQNPISSYGRKLFVFKLIDTIKVKDRTVYRVYFQPKNLRKSSLRGLLFIDAENYGVAKAFFRIYGVVNINATYTFNYLKENNLWFPEKRKFNVVKGTSNEDLKLFGGTIKFNSVLSDEKHNNASDLAYLQLESTPFDIKLNENQIIKDKFIKIEVNDDEINKPERFWNQIKNDSIDKRRLITYKNLDSLAFAENIERKILFGKKIFNGYLPINKIDFDLRSLIKYNNYEGFRFGIGGVTNEKLSENYKIAFHTAYGLKDEKFKFGISPSYRLEKKSNTWASVSYIDDLSEIGQITFATENKRFKIYDPRPFNISTFYENKTASAFIDSKFIPKSDIHFSIARSEIVPLFNYNFTSNGTIYDRYNLTLAQFALQWNPFSDFMQTNSNRVEINKNFPKFSFQITKSFKNLINSDFDFTKLDLKIQHDIPYLSGQITSFIAQVGYSVGAIPITHLYSIAPNNLDKNTLLKRITFAGKNSFETMYYNEFFSDSYFMLQARHTFDKIKLAYKVKPEVSFVTRMAFGTLENKSQHTGLTFKTLEKGFFESGIEANKMFKGFGLNLFYRYGPNGLPKFEDNLSLKISFNLDLGI